MWYVDILYISQDIEKQHSFKIDLHKLQPYLFHSTMLATHELFVA